MTHGRILVKGQDSGGGFLVSDRVALTAAHVVKGRKADEISFQAITGTPANHAVRRVVYGVGDVAALILHQPLPTSFRPARPTVGASWVAGERRESEDLTIRGKVVATGRTFRDNGGRACLVHELLIDGVVEDISGYSGTAVCLDYFESRVSGMIIEASHSEWLRRLGINLALGRIFALDIYECILSLSGDIQLARLMVGIPQSHAEHVRDLARGDSERRTAVRVGTRPQFVHAVPTLESTLKSSPWRDQARSHLIQLLHSLDGQNLHLREQIARRAAEACVDGNVSNDDIRKAIDNLELCTLVSRERTRRRLNRRRVQELDAIVGVLINLRDASSDTIFGLAGPFGSGKSRVLDECARSLGQQGIPVLQIDSSECVDLETAIVRAFRASMAVDVGDLDGIVATFDSWHGLILLIVDDIDFGLRRHPERLHNFMRVVSKLSCVPHLKWLISADDSRISDLFPLRGGGFWAMYGVTQEDPSPSPGWVDLRSRNIREQVGLKIVTSADPGSRPEFNSAGPEIREILASPLSAWLRAQHGKDAPVTSLNRPDFVQAYRAAILADAESLNAHGVIDVSSQDVDLALQVLGRIFADTRTDQAPFDYRKGESVGLSVERFGRAVDVLVERGVLVIEPIFPNPVANVRYAPLWAHEVFVSLFSGQLMGIDDWRDAVKDWVKADSDLSDGVLTHVYASTRPSRQEGKLSVWDAWARDPDLNIVAFLEAGLPADLYARSGVIKAARRSVSMHKGEYIRQRALFALLRYVAHDTCSCWSPSTRISSVSPHYVQVPKFGLSDYCRYALQRILSGDLGTKQEYLEVASELVGCEVTGVGGEIASDFVAAACRKFWNARSLAHFIESLLNLEPFRARVPDGDTSHSGGSFSELAVTGLAEALARIHRLKSFECAAAARLLGDTRTDLGMLFIRNYIMALGKECYRRGSHAERSEYLRLVERLVRGYRPLDPQQARTRAFFLVRHSVRTGHKLSVVVDVAFYPSLGVLMSDERLVQRLRKWAEPLFRANGIRPDRYALRQGHGRSNRIASRGGPRSPRYRGPGSHQR